MSRTILLGGVVLLLLGPGRERVLAQAVQSSFSFQVDSLGLAHVRLLSDADQYYVLFAGNASGTPAHAVDLVLGTGDSVELFDRLPALQRAAYTVRAYELRAPGDLDADGRDDLLEWRSSQGGAGLRQSPFNAARTVADPADGTVWLSDTAALSELAVASDGDYNYLAGAVFTKVYLTANASDTFGVYFQSARRHLRHEDFAAAIGIPTQANGAQRPGDMRGTLVYHADVVAPNGVLGLYTFQFSSREDYDFAVIERTYDLLAANMPFLRGNLAFRPLSERARDNYGAERGRYDASRVAVVSEEDLLGDLSYVGLHAAVGYGLLTVGDVGRSPTPFEVVIYDELPNTLPRVGGILTSVAQTPLSHVNLRAIQDNVPNAFVREARTDPRVAPLLGKYVRLEVTRDTFLLREATRAEVDAHFEALRPVNPQRFVADLSLREVVALDELGFADAVRVGAKAANLAELRRLGFPATTAVPNGYAIPFSFYVDFLRDNGLDAEIDAMLADPTFRGDFAEQERRLSELQRKIKRGQFSPSAYAALGALQQNFPAGLPIRCRSSTNGEDLPGFSGAGLYDSKTQHPDEGHLSKSIQQVYASLWNFRAFVERDFYRVEQRSALMAVLVHPNFEEELVNGVGVSLDALYALPDRYYLNAQVGEELVTNPTGRAVPEEILVRADPAAGIPFEVLRRSNLVPFGERVLAQAYILELRDRLTEIEAHFAPLYNARAEEAFAMEIEFKVDLGGQLVIKQARPWAAFRRNFVAVPEEGASLDIVLYPNPVGDQLSLKLEFPQGCTSVELRLYDAVGREVVRHAWAPGSGSQELTLQGLNRRLSPGAGFWVLTGCGGGVLGVGTLVKE